MARHSKYNQGKRKINGEKAEEYILSIVGGVTSGKEAYDIENDLYIYEVKSCCALTACKKKRKFKSYQLGRFQIKTANHLALKKIADEKKKVARYAFVLSVSGKLIYKNVDWENVKIDESREENFISWGDIFYNLK